MKYTDKVFKIILIVTLGLFLLFLIWALWLKFNDNYSIVLNYYWLSKMTLKERFIYDLIPFQYRFDVVRQVVITFLNSVIFMPFGVLLNLIFKQRNILRDILICFGISLFFEILQLFTIIGSFATSDLIMNVLGYFLGLPIYFLIFKKTPLKFNIIFFLVVNVCLVIILTYGAYNTIKSLDTIIGILTRTL